MQVQIVTGTEKGLKGKVVEIKGVCVCVCVCVSF